MSTATTPSKLPTDARALIRDPDLAAALERELKPYSGAKLERAQAAIRLVRQSGALGSFTDLLRIYREAIQAATAGGKSDD